MDTATIERLECYIRSLYPHEEKVPLHAPRFLGREKEYLAKCIDSTFVSYVGEFVTEFEAHICHLTGARHAVAMVNGTSALQMMLVTDGVQREDLVITQALTFAATAAAIRHAGGEPAFVDVDQDTLGMSPEALRRFLTDRAKFSNGNTYDRETGRRIAGVLPMHTFGHPVRIKDIAAICMEYDLKLWEDAAESLGSLNGDHHTGREGRAAILSFNGNKGVTTGGGGMLITDDEMIAQRATHLSTTAKRKHPWEFFHDEVGYNLRMPNINAALGCAQMEYFDQIVTNKRATANRYASFCHDAGIQFFHERATTRSNYWLNAILLEDRLARDIFLEHTNSRGIQTRPIWTQLSKLPPYSSCPRGDLRVSGWLEDRIVNLPSGLRV